METEAYIALGTNQGDRELNLLRAVAEIGKIPDSKITALSPFYSTSPVGNTDQPYFYNAVLKLATKLSSRDLLTHLLYIETTSFGRIRTTVWGPRRMDLDLLLHGELILDEADLKIPHPRMLERKFVLQPLHDIAPDLVPPQTGKTISELLASLDTGETITRV